MTICQTHLHCNSNEDSEIIAGVNLFYKLRLSTTQLISFFGTCVAKVLSQL